MMYKDLVKRLREVANEQCFIGCFGKCRSCGIEVVLCQAADAIEELRECVSAGEATIKRQSDIIQAKDRDLQRAIDAKPQWIPVTERLPETRESILGKKSSKVIVAFRFDDGTQGTDTAHTLNGEWVFEDHITVVARTITHWVRLPEPPKEGE